MAIVDYVSGNEETFVALMNQKAKALGMNHTHFTNAVGLHDENHYSTALDIAILMKAAMENPTCRQILGSVEYRTTSTQQHPNGMILLSTMYKRMYGNEVKNMTIIGGKTGFTDQAMQCLASYATAVDGNEYVVVTAYAPTEMNPVFDSFAMYGLVNGGYEMPTHLEKQPIRQQKQPPQIHLMIQTAQKRHQMQKQNLIPAVKTFMAMAIQKSPTQKNLPRNSMNKRRWKRETENQKAAANCQHCDRSCLFNLFDFSH